MNKKGKDGFFFLRTKAMTVEIIEKKQKYKLDSPVNRQLKPIKTPKASDENKVIKGAV